MNKKILILLPILLSSCSQDDPLTKPTPIYNHFNNDVVISKGFNYNTKKQIALDSYTGTVIEPCHKSTKLKSNKNNDNDPCNVNLPEDIEKEIEEITKKQFTVKVIKGNGDIDYDGKLIYSASVLFKGSHCEVTYSGGTKTAICTKDGWLNFCINNEKYRYRTDVSASAKEAIKYCEDHYWK